MPTGGWMLVARAFIVAMVMTAAANAVGRPDAHDTLVAAFARVNNSRAGDHECGAVLATVNELLAAPASAKLPSVDRIDANRLGAWCSIRLHDTDMAYRFALAGTALEGAGADLWQARFGIEQEYKKPVAAVATIAAMATANPEALAAIPVRQLYALRRSLDALPDHAADRRLLEVLTMPSYVPDEGATVNDPFKFDYAAILAAGGDRPAAAALVARITEPSVLMGVSVDPRVRDLLPSDFDGRAAAEARLAQAREVAASHSGSLYALLDVSRYLRLLGRYDEALATLEAARPDAQGAAFTDLEKQLNWYWDEMARLYERLGRYDDAVATFHKAIDAKEDGGRNVSQTINLGEAQLRFGRDAEALATIKAFDTGGYGISAFGEMELRVARGCALIALGQTAAASKDVAYMAAHERDGPEPLTEIYLCAGDLDAAAAVMIRRLDNPVRRSDALLLLSDYDPPAPRYPLSPYYARLSDLKARADVQAAIKRAGGARRFHLQFEEL